MMLEKIFLNQQNLGVPEAYLHTSREIKEEKEEFNNLTHAGYGALCVEGSLPV